MNEISSVRQYKPLSQHSDYYHVVTVTHSKVTSQLSKSISPIDFTEYFLNILFSNYWRPEVYTSEILPINRKQSIN